MAKIKFEKWDKNVPFTRVVSGYSSVNFNWWKTNSELHTSRGVAVCPCCNTENDIYIWSFCGGGKRCGKCNVFLGSGGAFVNNDEVENVEVSHNGNIFYLNHVSK